MNLSLPETWAVSVEALLGAIITLIVSAWMARAAYSSIMAKLDTLSVDIEAMKLRNQKADQETELVKSKQSAQDTAIAVIQTSTLHHGATLERIERALGKVADKLEAQRQ